MTLPDRRPSLEDVARLAGVSITTASRVINGSAHPVSEQTRRRVLKAVATLDYHPDALARNLKRQLTQTIGAVVHDISDSYYSEVVRGAEDHARRHGYVLMVSNAYRIGERILSCLRTFREHRAAGVVLAGSDLTDRGHWHEMQRQVESMQRQGIVVVGLATQKVRMPCIRTDNVAIGRMMTEYLLGKGHRRIAFVSGPQAIFTSHERHQGYREALERAQVAYDPRLVVWDDFTKEGGFRAATRLIEAGPPFTAMFASNDEMAIGALLAFRTRGIRVPQDVSLVGSNDIPLARYSYPPLTTLRVPMYDMGVQAVELILQVAASRDRAKAIRDLQDFQHFVPLQIVERDSVASMA
jgi:LacI family transcriptional regulator